MRALPSNARRLKMVASRSNDRSKRGVASRKEGRVEIESRTGRDEVERPSLVLPGSDGVTREVLVERARAMVPTLRKRAQATEEARQMLPVTLEEFKQAGFFRICQPRRFGGFALGIDALEEVLIEIGRGCGSSAWTLGILSGHSWFAAGFSEEGQRELFGEDGHALI